MRITPGIATAAAFAGGAGLTTAVAHLAAPDSGARRAAQIGSGLLGGLIAAGAFTLGRSLPANVRTALIGAGGGMAAAGVVDAVAGAIGSTAADGPLRRGDVLPDGEQLQPEQIYVQGNDLRFDSFVANTGKAPLQLALHASADGTTSTTNQVIYNENGTRRQVPIRGGFNLDTRSDHNHLHFNDFVYFQLFRTDASGSPTDQLSAGIKQSFFITDVADATGAPAENVAAWQEIQRKLEARGETVSTGIDATTTQRISVGKADVYGAGLQGQSLDISTVEPGVYVLRQTFDPNDEVIEMDERNNSRDIRIEITADRQVRVLDSHLVDPTLYERQADGRTIIPSVVEAMRHTAEHGGAESGHTH